MKMADTMASEPGGEEIIIDPQDCELFCWNCYTALIRTAKDSYKCPKCGISFSNYKKDFHNTVIKA